MPEVSLPDPDELAALKNTAFTRRVALTTIGLLSGRQLHPVGTLHRDAMAVLTHPARPPTAHRPSTTRRSPKCLPDGPMLGRCGRRLWRASGLWRPSTTSTPASSVVTGPIPSRTRGDGTGHSGYKYVKRTFAWEDTCKRLLLRFEPIKQ